MSMFWETVGANLLAALLAAGSIGGLFWRWLDKGLDSRIEKLLDEHRTKLAAQLHKENTAYSRIDEKRAEGLQTLYGRITSHKMQAVLFPQRALVFMPDGVDVATHAMQWWAQRQAEAQDILGYADACALLFPEALTQNIGLWFVPAQGLCQEHLRQIALLAGQTDWASLSRTVKVARINALYTSYMELEPGGVGYLDACFRILGELKAVYHAHGEPPRITSWFDPVELDAMKKRVADKVAANREHRIRMQAGAGDAPTQCTHAGLAGA